ncbi:MAG TPA: hypothetical protein VII06_09965 [Chloroflexota bacterium]
MRFSSAEIYFEELPVKHTALDQLVDAFKAEYMNGGAILSCFAAVGRSVPDWETSEEHRPLIRSLLCSPVVSSLLAAASAGRQNAVRPPAVERQPASELDLSVVDPLTLDGRLARQLVAGGPYSTFDMTWAEAKAIAVAACTAMFEDRYEDVHAFNSYKPWHPWFLGIAWDATWVLIDHRTNRVWLFCVTDTD